MIRDLDVGTLYFIHLQFDLNSNEVSLYMVNVMCFICVCRVLPWYPVSLQFNKFLSLSTQVPVPVIVSVNGDQTMLIEVQCARYKIKYVIHFSIMFLTR